MERIRRAGIRGRGRSAKRRSCDDEQGSRCVAEGKASGPVQQHRRCQCVAETTTHRAERVELVAGGGIQERGGAKEKTRVEWAVLQVRAGKVCFDAPDECARLIIEAD